MAWRRILRNTADYLDRVQNPFVLPEERLLFSFAEQSDLDRWKVFQDRDIGGKSTAELRSSLDHPGTAILSGNFSSEIDRELAEKLNSKIQRSGFAGITSKDEEAQFEGLDEYDALVFRIFGDGRKYIANIRTDNWIIGTKSDDVWQAFVFASTAGDLQACRKGGWQEVTIPFESFLLSWKGKLVETRQEMNPSRIMSLGFAIAGDKINRPGRYSLGIDWIKAKRLRGVLEDGRSL